MRSLNEVEEATLRMADAENRAVPTYKVGIWRKEEETERWG